MEEMSPSPDGRMPLHPNLDAIRKVAPQISIAPDPVISELMKVVREEKEAYASNIGPGSHKPRFKLVERRADIGVREF